LRTVGYLSPITFVEELAIRRRQLTGANRGTPKTLQPTNYCYLLLLSLGFARNDLYLSDLYVKDAKVKDARVEDTWGIAPSTFAAVFPFASLAADHSAADCRPRSVVTRFYKPLTSF
jgi:hypothetical protein